MPVDSDGTVVQSHEILYPIDQAEAPLRQYFYTFPPYAKPANPSAAPVDIALSYLRDNAGDFGVLSADFDNVRVWGNYLSESTGVTHVSMRQTLNGLDVMGTDMNVNVASDGMIVSAGGKFVRNIGRYAQLPATPAFDAVAALNLARAELSLTPTSALGYLQTPSGSQQASLLQRAGISLEDIPAKLNYVARPEGSVELAWNLEIQTTDGQHWYSLNVGVQSQNIISTKDFVANAAYHVYEQPKRSPYDGSTTIQVNPEFFQPVPLSYPSPLGWHDVNGLPGPDFPDTRGNNVDAYLDEDADNQPDPGSRPNGGPNGTFIFPVDLNQSPDTYKEFAVTNLFYWNNIAHDVFYLYGFDEGARNFQATNYRPGGLGSDDVRAEAQDGSGFNNANFATPPDGQRPRMQMFESNFTVPNRDSDLDAEVIVHEYGHGVSNRLTGDGMGLNAYQSRGMGEGWSDFFGLLLTQTGPITRATSRGIANYFFGMAPNGPGIRQNPYSYDLSVNPSTFNDLNALTPIHFAGQMNTSVLWDMTVLLVEKYGFEPNIYNSTSGAGNVVAMHLVMNALKLQPVDPSFIDFRDALFAADFMLTGGVNQGEIWQAYSRRGLGPLATTASANATTVTTDFRLPADSLNNLPVFISINDVSVVEGNGLVIPPQPRPVPIIPVLGPAPGFARFSLTRTGAIDRYTWVRINTVDREAIAPQDYSVVSTLVRFEPRESVRFVDVPIVADALLEGNETFIVTVTQPSVFTFILDADGFATIIDDDRPTNPGTYNPGAGEGESALTFAEGEAPLTAGDGEAAIPSGAGTPAAGAAFAEQIFGASVARGSFTESAAAGLAQQLPPVDQAVASPAAVAAPTRESLVDAAFAAYRRSLPEEERDAELARFFALRPLLDVKRPLTP